jgi:hypothetical protein
MNRKSLILIIVQSFIIILLIWIVILMGSDEFTNIDIDDDDANQSFVEVNSDGLNQVRLTDAIKNNSGIISKEIVKSNKEMTFSNYGIVQATDTLIDLKNIQDQLLSDLSTLENQFKTENKKLKAFVTLNEDNKNISDQALSDQQILVANISGSIDNINILLKNLKQKVLSQWGDEFYKLIKNEKPIKNLQSLLDGKSRLVKITLPSSEGEQVIPKKILFNPINGSKEIEGYFVSKAPTVDPSLLGQTFYYLINSSDIRIGSKLIGFYQNTNDKKISLFELPHNSIIWSSGLPWVYVEKESAVYIKKPVVLKNEIKGGWLASSDNISDNDKVVIKGAQLLLSEEYKYQIKNENED